MLGKLGSDDADTVRWQEKKVVVCVMNGIIVLLGVWTLYCLVIVGSRGITETWEHFGIAMVMVCSLIHLLVSFTMCQKSEQEGKDNILVHCMFCFVVVLIAGLVLTFGATSEECEVVNYMMTPCNQTQCNVSQAQYLNTQTNTCVTCNGTSGTGYYFYQQLYGSKLK